MELTQRRPSGYSTSRPEKLGSKKMGSNTFHSVVARARKSTLERVSMLTSVDDADMDNELLFESFVRSNLLLDPNTTAIEHIH